MRLKGIRRALALTLSATLLLASCGPKMAATTMHLRKTEGTVGVSDGEGKEVKPKEKLGLYSGYGVDTKNESYAWIDLDEVKLTKLDQDSEIEIKKEDKRLEIEVLSGSLFFNVTEPLAEDETMEIRTSSMMVGIRGTCGWVEVPDGDHLNVFILEGTVECAVEDTEGKITSASVSGGQSARVSVREEEAPITLGTFGESGVPGFVLRELEEKEDLCGLIEEASGLDILNWDPAAELAAGLEAIGYHGDPAACAMTAEQRAAYAQVLREEIGLSESTFTPYNDGYISSSRPVCFAGLVDVGGGNPALMFGSAMEVTGIFGTELWGATGGTSWGIWQFADGRAVKLDGLDRTEVYPDHLYVGGHYVADPGIEAGVYPFENGRIASSPSTTAKDQSEWYWPETRPEERTIDGQIVTAEQIDAWAARWSPGNSLAGFSHGSDVSVNFWGLSPARDVLDVLEGNGSAPREENAPERTIATYDPNTHIRRTTLDTGSDPIEIYFEIPVFEEAGAGYQKINDFFRNRQEQFFAGGFDEERRIARESNPYNETYFDYWEAGVMSQTEKLVCVQLVNQSHMGGPHPNSEWVSYTFRADTGEALTLTQAADGSPEEIEQFMLSYLSGLNAGEYDGLIDMDFFQGYGADDYTFYIEDGRIFVGFNRYEGIPYFAGELPGVELPMGLKAELRG